MSGRPNKRQDIDLSTLLDPVNGQRFECGFAIIQIIGAFNGGLPITPAGLEFTFDDSPTFYPYAPGFKLQTPDGAEKFSSFTVRGPRQVGTLTVMFTDDPIPLLSGGSGWGGAGRYLDFLWLPHIAGAPGSVLQTKGISKDGSELANFINPQNLPPGVAPQMSFRGGRQCLQLLPRTGGISGIFLYHTLPWVPARVAGILTGQVNAKVQSYGVGAEIGRDGAGGTETLGSGLYFVPSDGVTVNEGNPGATAAFMGVVGDGAGSWRFAARALAGGALTVNESIAAVWPSVTLPVRVLVVLIDADTRAGRDGIVQVYLNDVPVKTYTDMTKFPQPYANGATGDVSFRPKIMQQGFDAQSINLAKIQLWTAAGGGVPNL